MALGYGDLRHDGLLDHLYCRADMAGRGIGTALCLALEAHAAALGLARLRVEASEGACRLFERRGFVVERRQDLILRSVALHNYRMAKPLG